MKNPKVILITGASSGIGKTLALSYANVGIKLFLTGRNEERLREVCEHCRKKGAKVSFASIDVKDKDRLREWIIECDNEAPIDLVIANAGVARTKKVHTEEVDREIFTINLFGVLNTVYPAIDIMKPRKHGQIAIMSSLAAMISVPVEMAYSSSKNAVKVFGHALRTSLESKGIEVCVICPGFVKTPLTDKNKYVMPFIMSSEKAAKKIINALTRNKGLIVFPLSMYFILWLMRLFPHKLMEKVNKTLAKYA